MTSTTKLSFTDELPLTCSRTGSCCHGKMVRLNPWELAKLAGAKGLSPREFRDAYCDYGGIQLRFDGEPGWKGLSSCSQYKTGFGCKVHSGRPLVCRLYPLGRQKQGEKKHYIYQGGDFPCLEGCPEVVDLPSLTVSQYIDGQGTRDYEAVQDSYLELMQDIADGAFSLFLESGLSESGDKKTLRLWREMGGEKPEELAKRIGAQWIDRLMLPDLEKDRENSQSFTESHFALLQSAFEEKISPLESPDEYCEASVLLMGLALHLGRALGAEPSDLAAHWIGTAKTHGGLE